LSLLERLRALGADDRAIYAILLEGFEGSRISNEQGQEEFWNGTEPSLLYLILHHRDNRITRLQIGKLLEPKVVQANLVEKARVALDCTQGSFVVSRHLFGRLPLKGEFRWNERLRLRPCTDDTIIGRDLDERQHILSHISQNNDSHLGPPFPFLMEIRVPKSSNIILESNRFMRELEHYQNALTLLLAGDVHYAHLPQSPLWVSLMRNAQMENHLLNFGFSDPHGGKHDDYPAYAGPAAPIYADLDYYERLWVRDEELMIPATLGVHLELIEGLDKVEADKFHRACYWFAQGVQFRNVDSIGVPSFAAAIECLLPSANEKCGECGRSAGDGLTKSFNKFLDRYGKISDQLKVPAKQLYDARSKLVHGSHTHRVDTDFFSFDHSVDWQNMLIWMMAKRGLIGWLEDKERASWDKQ
jgi:Apea-like HEPN